ncbi:MAG: hypothetical protein KBA66_21655 [Leptospiraceae bacterium]|nr:hypothetical protein [Leptospiraceae bacterium]
MRINIEYKTTENSSVWKKAHKNIYAPCSFCRWHRGDNANVKKRNGRKKKTFRDYRFSS